MPLYVKDPEVTAWRNASRRCGAQARRRSCGKPFGVNWSAKRRNRLSWMKGVVFVQALKTRGRPSAARAADKAFIDGLYDKS